MSHISREEMMQLLGVAPARAKTPGQAVAHLAPSPEPALPKPSSEEAMGVAPRMSAFGPVHALLGRALPRLWRYAQSRPEASDTRKQHRKLRDLIAWVLTKEGYRVRPHAATPYPVAGEIIRGRLELLIERPPGCPVLALETGWTEESSSLGKLQVWHQRGVPVLWIVGRPCTREKLHEFRVLANRMLREDSTTWLPIYHLEHGWLKFRSLPVDVPPA